ncbi:hypothetical protein VNI00_014886 [Paramarasmius palmivorus]|uniref:Uncharacterized protein n=1 Tax=Paramarasmius palmivorus TaxID=297713 RepID=A0AAW0BNC9_9AGAR
MERIESLQRARKIGRKRWQNRLSAARHYSRNQDSKKAYSRNRGAQKRAEFSTLTPDLQEDIRERKREQQRLWRQGNAAKLAMKQRERRARKSTCTPIPSPLAPDSN